VANQEHIAILKQGVKAWNSFRKEHLGTYLDLSGADLSGLNLRKADLSQSNLSGANLSGADLNGADLRLTVFGGTILKSAILRNAILSSFSFHGSGEMSYIADLSGVDLREADLTGVNLQESDLVEANLRGATLIHVDFRRANLIDADLSEAQIAQTNFGDVDLRNVKGLDTITHLGPSTIGIDTIINSHGYIPEIFLRGAGVPPSIIEQIPALIGSLSPIDYYSCFISYSSKDHDFAEWLYADLQSKGVRCWFAPEDMKTGDVIRSRIDEAIRVHDKLLLVLSEHSVESSWVEKEVETAFEKERQQKRHVLFPVRLDNVVMQTSTSWAADIRRMRHITDFTDWKDHDAYQKAFARLLRDLKAET
jgi:uncharacterized protein YjbI with pentapeptide repeats